MTSYVRSIWQLRYFWLSIVKHDLHTRYRRSVLGLGWSLMSPIGMTIVLCIVFHKLFNMNIREFAPFLLVGLAFWGFVVQSVQSGCTCFFAAESYMRQYPAPLAIYPLRVVLGAGFHLLLTLCVVIMLVWGLRGFDNVPALISLVPAAVLLLTFAWSLATLAGLLNTHFPDTQHLSELALQATFYMTPIIYTPALLREKGLGALVTYNPIAALIELVRLPVLEAEIPTAGAYGTAAAFVFIIFFVASASLARLQRTLIFHI